MITFVIKTWGCKCGYRQDFEPTMEAAAQHFNDLLSFPIGDLAADECPSCALKGKRGKKLVRVVDSTKKMVMNVLEQSDIDAMLVQAEEETRRVKVGDELRLETDQEKLERVTQEAETAPDLTKKEKTTLRNELVEQPNIVRSFIVYRDETLTEKAVRIKKIKDLVPKTKEEVAELKKLYQDDEL